MKKVLLLSPEFGLEKGGIQTWAYYIDKLLKKENFKITSMGIREISILDIPKLIISNFNSDIFILMTWKMIVGVIFALLLSPFTKKRFYIFVHGNDILNLSNLEKKIIQYLIKNKKIFFIANSNAIGNVFFNIFSKKIDFVLNPFIDTQIQLENIVANKNQFFTITRLIKRKNIDNVIKALKILDDENYDFIYYISGTGTEENNLKNLVKNLDLENKIKFLGRISEEQKNKYLATSSLFLLPSLFDDKDGSIEGYGIVYIEANIFGVPVIAGNTGGIIEAVVDGVTGYHTDGTISEIVKSVKDSIDNKFDKIKIINFSKQHDYRIQKSFIKFITSSNNE